jgi:hypothetical protein
MAETMSPRVMAEEVRACDLQRMTPAEHLAHVRKLMDLHILACPSSPERNALTSANMMLYEQSLGKRIG